MLALPSIPPTHAEAQASAQASGKGQALAQALAQAQAVSQCLANIPACSSQPFASDCCNSTSAVSAGRCGCVGSVCTYKLASQSPLVWQNSVISSQQCRC